MKKNYNSKNNWFKPIKSLVHSLIYPSLLSILTLILNIKSIIRINWLTWILLFLWGSAAYKVIRQILHYTDNKVEEND